MLANSRLLTPEWQAKSLQLLGKQSENFSYYPFFSILGLPDLAFVSCSAGDAFCGLANLWADGWRRERGQQRDNQYFFVM